MPVCIGPLIPLIVVALLILVLVFIVKMNQRQEEKEKKRREEAERKRRKLREKYDAETPARRDLICQLYHESIDLKEITFILRKAGYNGPTGEPITMEEIMDEHAQMQIEKHIKSQTKRKTE